MLCHCPSRGLESRASGLRGRAGPLSLSVPALNYTSVYCTEGPRLRDALNVRSLSSTCPGLWGLLALCCGSNLRLNNGSLWHFGTLRCLVCCLATAYLCLCAAGFSILYASSCLKARMMETRRELRRPSVSSVTVSLLFSMSCLFVQVPMFIGCPSASRVRRPSDAVSYSMYHFHLSPSWYETHNSHLPSPY